MSSALPIVSKLVLTVTSDFIVAPDTRKCLLSASELGSPRTVYLVRSSNRRIDGVASERGHQLMPAPRPSAMARDSLVTKAALRKMKQYWARPRRVPTSI